MKKKRKGRLTGLEGKDNRLPEMPSVGFSSRGYSATQEEKYADTCGQVALWRAVLMQALVDLGTKTVNKYDEASKRWTQQWLDIKNKDFRMVCSLADLEAVYILRKIETVDERKELIKALNRRYI